ncbi:MAG: futalosine hydrolase [Vicinamibacterales bacterium]
MSVELLLCVATELEGAVLRDRLRPVSGIQVVRMGVGPVNAAHAATIAITRERPSAIVVCGVGGAYPGSGLSVGDVACAETECYGDLGAGSPTGFLDMKALGFPIVESPVVLYNDLPLQVFPVKRRVKFVTVTTCTGTEAAARAIAARTGGAVESMEGAAVVHVAHLHGVPVGELRGISNLVTDRDPSAWRLKEAAAAAQEALLAWMGQL